MCVCMYACIYCMGSTYIHMNACIHKVHTYTRIQADNFLSQETSKKYIHTYSYMHTHTYIFIHAYTYIQADNFSSEKTSRKYIHTHSYIHTHRPIISRPKKLRRDQTTNLVYIHTYIHTYIYTYTQADNFSPQETTQGPDY